MIAKTIWQKFVGNRTFEQSQATSPGIAHSWQREKVTTVEEAGRHHHSPVTRDDITRMGQTHLQAW